MYSAAETTTLRSDRFFGAIQPTSCLSSTLLRQPRLFKYIPKSETDPARWERRRAIAQKSRQKSRKMKSEIRHLIEEIGIPVLKETYAQRWYRALKNDPMKHAAWKESKKKAYNDRRMIRLQDPEATKAFKEKNRLRRQKKKESDLQRQKETDAMEAIKLGGDKERNEQN